jgi:hypothetical protein
MKWLRDQVIVLPGVAGAELGADARGRETLIVTLGAHSQSEPSGDPMESLLDADIAPMLVFDSETLEIAGSNRKAATVFELDGADGGFSLADLFTPSELDRLGRRLATEADEWADGDDWLMVTRTGKQISVHNWYAPNPRGRHRLLISLPAVEA